MGCAIQSSTGPSDSKTAQGQTEEGGAGVPCSTAGAAGTCCQTNPGFGIGRLTACGIGGAGGGGSELGCDLSDCGGVLDLRDLPRSLRLRRSLDLELSELLLRLRRSPILNGNPHGFGNMILRAPALFSHTQFRAPAQWLGKQPASHCKVLAKDEHSVHQAPIGAFLHSH